MSAAVAIICVVAIFLLIPPASQPTANLQRQAHTFLDADYNLYLLKTDDSFNQVATSVLSVANSRPVVSNSGQSFAYFDGGYGLSAQFAGEDSVSKIADNPTWIHKITDEFIVYTIFEHHKVRKDFEPTTQNILIQLAAYLKVYEVDFQNFEVEEIYDAVYSAFKEKYPSETVDDAKLYYYQLIGEQYVPLDDTPTYENITINQNYYYNATTKTYLYLADSEHDLFIPKSEEDPTHIVYVDESGNITIVQPDATTRIIATSSSPKATTILGSTPTCSIVVWAVEELDGFKLYQYDSLGVRQFDTLSLEGKLYSHYFPNSSGNQLSLFVNDTESAYIFEDGKSVTEVYKGVNSGIFFSNRTGNTSFVYLDSLSDLYYVATSDVYGQDSLYTSSLYTFGGGNHRQVVLDNVRPILNIVNDHIYYVNDADSNWYVCDWNGKTTSNHIRIADVSFGSIEPSAQEDLVYLWSKDYDFDLDTVYQYSYGKELIPVLENQSLSYFNVHDNGGLSYISNLREVLSKDEKGYAISVGTLYYAPPEGTPIMLGENAVCTFFPFTDLPSIPFYFLKDCDVVEKYDVKRIKGTLCVFDGQKVTEIAQDILYF